MTRVLKNIACVIVRLRARNARDSRLILPMLLERSMRDLRRALWPTLFVGGRVGDYEVVATKDGGVGTLHLRTGKVVPHVRSEQSTEELSSGGAAFPGLQPLVVHANVQIKGGLGLAGSGLAVGWLALALGGYTAVKVHALGDAVEEVGETVRRSDARLARLAEFVRSATVELDRLVRQNGELLGLLLERGAELEEGLAALERQVEAGFARVIETFASAEARRRSQELEQQMRTLYSYWEACAARMSSGREPAPADLRSVVEVGTGLAGWVETRLRESARGVPERLPLLVARAFALHLEREARGLLDQAPEAREPDRRRLLETIREEVQALTAGASAYALAVASRPIIEQYVFLHRAVRAPATVVELADGTMLAFHPASLCTWDDGLARVRELVHGGAGGPPAGECLELRTLREFIGWEQLSGWPGGGREVSVDVARVRAALGIPPELALGEGALRELLEVGPDAAADGRRRIQEEMS